MKRRLWTIVAALSAVLFVTTIGLWIGSVWFTRLIWQIGDDPPRALVMPIKQRVVFRLVFGDDVRAPSRVDMKLLVADLRIYRASLGSYDTGTVEVPYWMLATVFVILPALWTVRFVRHRRRESWRSANRCLTCGYDLRATPERCPECGSVPTRGAS